MGRLQIASHPWDQNTLKRQLFNSFYYFTLNNHNKHAYAGQLNRFTHLRALLLVLRDRGIFGPGSSRRRARKGGDLRLVCGKRCAQISL